MEENTQQPLPKDKLLKQDQSWKPDHIIKQEAEKRKAKIRIVKLCFLYLSIFAVVVSIIYVVLFQVNHFRFDVIISGDSEIILEYGTPYQESGVKAILTGTMFWKDGVQGEDKPG